MLTNLFFSFDDHCTAIPDMMMMMMIFVHIDKNIFTMLHSVIQYCNRVNLHKEVGTELTKKKAESRDALQASQMHCGAPKFRVRFGR